MAQVTALAVGLAACESPARVKPWRHAPDPVAEAQAQPPSPAVAEAATDEQVHAAHAHTLRISVDAEPGRLTPLVAPSVWARRITLGTVFEPLIRYEAGQYSPRLAHEWKVMPGGMEIRIQLEPGVTFHDGKLLTTSDVQFTLDAVRDPHKGIDHLRAMLDDVEAIELITSHEIRLRLKRPSGWVLRALAEIPILPMHVYDGSLLAGGALVGTGPYRYVSNKGGVVHLTRYDHYWGAPPAIADVEFVHQADAAIALKDAKRGDIDIVPALIPAHWPEQANSPGITAAFAPLQLAPPRLRALVFNSAREPTSDPAVRHALALLVDRRAIAKRVFVGLWRPVLWPIWPGGLVSGPEAPVPEFDPAGAAKLLDAAGWTDSDKDGVRDKDGKQLRLVMVGTEGPAHDLAAGPQPKTERDLFVDAARRAGVMMEIKTGSEAWLQKKLGDGGYDVAELSIGGMVDEDLAPLVGHGSAKIDRAFDLLATAWDPAERAKQAPELAAAFAEEWPLAGIVAEAPQGLVAKRVTGVKIWDGWIDVAALSFVSASGEAK
ncbi:MAG TPA: ABC transporter substrate-binding protein [Kofleriaceae bacterium]